MRRLFPHPLLTVLLVGLWLLLVNELSAGHFVLGVFLGWVIPFLTRDFWPEHVAIHTPLRLIRFLGIFVWDILIGSLQVSWLILKGPRHVRPAFVTVPLRLKTDFAISLLANTISLTPGTVSARLSADKTRLLVHTLDTDDAAALVATIQTRYEAPIRAIFEGEAE